MGIVVLERGERAPKEMRPAPYKGTVQFDEKSSALKPVKKVNWFMADIK